MPAAASPDRHPETPRCGRPPGAADEPCPRCGMAMVFVKASWHCEGCRYKEGCC
jgi:hypothetical protein